MRAAQKRATVFTLAFACGRLLFAGNAALHREGAFWVENTSGAEAIGEGEQLKITSIGDISVHGGNKSQVEYTIVRKVRARNEGEAREQLREAGVGLTRQGRYLRLAVDDSTGAVNLQVIVPRTLQMVVVGTAAGSVEISDFGGNVLAETGAGDVRLNHIKGSAQVNTAGGTLHLGEIGAWAQVTTSAGDITAESIGGEARLETGGGDITVQKTGANIRAVTAGGRVRIGQAAGGVVASTGGGGMIDIGRAGGSVSARNQGGGPITVGSALGGVQCQSASGEIRVGGAGGAMRIVTGAGSLVAQFGSAQLRGESFLSTGSGDITVSIPSNLGVTIRAQNTGAFDLSGIVSEFAALQVRAARGLVTAQGVLNGGGPLLRIQGTSGTIRIKKK